MIGIHTENRRGSRGQGRVLLACHHAATDIFRAFLGGKREMGTSQVDDSGDFHDEKKKKN